jgi:hypothetical protein
MDWVVMAMMGGWGGTVEEVGLFVAHKGVRLVVFFSFSFRWLKMKNQNYCKMKL